MIIRLRKLSRGVVGNRATRLGPTPTTMISAEDKNIIERFETLEKLMNEGLITKPEFNARRKANLVRSSI